jgi:hypothetical protein
MHYLYLPNAERSAFSKDGLSCNFYSHLMASIVKRSKSKYYTACFTNREGRQLKRSTKTTDKNQAMQIAIELERVESLPLLGNGTQKQ